MAKASRLELHEELCTLLGSRNVYFQPPESIKMKYPCIVYSLSNVDYLNASNRIYKSDKSYEITIIDPDPDGNIYERMPEHFSMCRFNREYTVEDLNHYVYTIFY